MHRGELQCQGGSEAPGLMIAPGTDLGETRLREEEVAAGW